MKQIAQDVYLIEGLRASNVYLLVSDAGLTLIDAGMAGDADQIAAQIQGGGYALSELATIIITHVHTDHTGSVAALVRRSGAQVIAHQDEVPYIEGTESLPASTVLQRTMRWLANLLPGGGKALEVTRGLEDGEMLDTLGGLRVIHTPGHTPGSMCLYQEEKGVLFCGDLLFNGHPFTGRGGLQYAPRLFSADPAEVKCSAQKLAGLQVNALCAGHGEPILREDGVKMKALLETARA
jgi:glyoxylase-like metal-dependent hydrolase (beta-lactamase superfamily II)